MPNHDHPNGPTLCVTCAVYRPDSEPRQPNRPPVCDGDRLRIHRELGDITHMADRLANPEPVEFDDRWYETVLPACHGLPAVTVARRADPLAAVGGVSAIDGRSRQPSVSGSRDPALPISVEVIDLMAPAREPNPTAQGRRWPADELGRLSAATVLDQWVRDWRHTLWPDHSLPPATVTDLVTWIRNGPVDGTRLDVACDLHPAIDDFAAEVHALHYALRQALGETEPPPHFFKGVPCKRCDVTSQLAARVGEDYIDCGCCGLLYTAAELADWIKLVSGHERAIRTPQEIAELLRPSRRGN